MKYNLKSFDIINSGSSRLVTKNSENDDTVLKFSINKFGYLQNIEEFNTYKEHSVNKEIQSRLAISYNLIEYNIGNNKYNILVQERLNTYKKGMLTEDYALYCNQISVIAPTHNKVELIQPQQIGYTSDNKIKCLDYGVLSETDSLHYWESTKTTLNNKVVTKLDIFYDIINVIEFVKYYEIEENELETYFSYLFPYVRYKVKHSDVYSNTDITDKEMTDIVNKNIFLG